MPTEDTLELYTDTASDFRWRYTAANGRTLADSAEGYEDLTDAIRGAAHVLYGDPNALDVEDLPTRDPDGIRRLKVATGHRTT